MRLAATVAGAELGDRFTGDHPRQFTFPRLSREPMDVVEVHSLGPQDIIYVPMAHVTMSCGNFAMSIDPGKSARTERTPDVCVAAGRNTALPERPDRNDAIVVPGDSDRK